MNDPAIDYIKELYIKVNSTTYRQRAILLHPRNWRHFINGLAKYSSVPLDKLPPTPEDAAKVNLQFCGALVVVTTLADKDKPEVLMDSN